MPTQIGSIIRKATRKPGEKLNVLSFVTHERFQSNWSSCNCQFYLLQNGPGCKGMWKTEYAQIPSNTIILPTYQNNPLEVIPPWMDIDVIVSQHKFGQIQTALQLKKDLGCSHVHVEHTMPTNDNLRKAVPELAKLRGDINIFISKTSRNQWSFTEDDSEVIEHGIDTDFFKSSGRPRKQQLLTVGNDMVNRSEILGFDTLQRVCQGLPLKIVGDTAGLSQPAKNVYELKNFYDESLLYINPSRFSPIPMSLLEAASVGCAIITTDNNLISTIFKNNVNGIITNDERVMRESIQRLLNNPDECRRLGEAARKTIIDRFPLSKFVSSWDSVLERAANL